MSTNQDQWSWKDRILLFIVPRIYSLVLRLLALTIRKKFLFPDRPQKFWDQGQPIIGAFWHQRLLMMPFLPRGGRRVGMLISQHRDGEFIARAVKHLGIDSVRGSTTRASLSGLRGMVRFYRDGANLAITPDGPQGPKHVVQKGVVELARQTGAPLLPVTYGASRKKVFGSWDNFILPLPFCKVVYLWGEPLFIPQDADKDRMEEYRRMLQERMRQITEEADLIFQANPYLTKSKR
ncbi:MAG: lysophospholipid acyltransferase family protein [Deltaproteobacteria bacterium]|jgi:lysophospholipid acyltransferase (LPLAT)-like uncharacterized protein|nr:lysophospholipid acyltransferase family protein [Deltaproteobacteria bacterium]